MPNESAALLQELRQIIDEQQFVAEQDKLLRGRRKEIELRILRFAEQHDLTKLGDDQINVTVQEKLRGRYDPAAWQGIVKWAVDTGHEYIVQRRLSDAKIVDLVESGTELPDGLTLEPYSQLSVRRK